MTPTFADPLPHADLLARVRAAAPNRMADCLRTVQWSEILAAHPDVVLLDSRDETVEEA